MTNDQMSSMFEMQRGIVQQNQQAVAQFFDAQRTASQAVVDALESLRSAQEQNAELTRDAVHAYVDALEEIAPNADFSVVREQIDGNLDQLEDVQADTWDGLLDAMKNGQDSVEEYGETYGDLVESSFDSFLDAHETVADDLEDAETVEFAG